MGKIPVGIVGVGNCASSLLQGIEFYSSGDHEPIGLMHRSVGGYGPSDIEVVCAFDIDRRKVGTTIDRAAMAAPNNTRPIHPTLPRSHVVVEMGHVLDGVAEHMADYPDERDVPGRRPASGRRRGGAPEERCRGRSSTTSRSAASSPPSTTHAPASRPASRMVNCIPVFIVSDPQWAAEFERRGIPIVGDDVKSQLGATIVHRMLCAALRATAASTLDRTYQLNTGGNTDFLNMLNRSRTDSKRISKTEAVQSVLPQRLPATRTSTSARATTCRGSSDNKVCFLRMEGRGFGNVADRASSCACRSRTARTRPGVVIDAIRCCRSPATAAIGGPLLSVSSYFMKHPPQQMTDDQARDDVERFLRGELAR